jgi:sortase B
VGKARRQAAERQWKKRRQKIAACFAVITVICAVAIVFIAYDVVIPYVSDMTAFRREQAAMPDLSPFDAHWLEINPDYAGCIKIDGTHFDFPVVRGSDNEKYLTTTFGGEENILGAIFMDYRCAGEDVPHIIVYGHEAQDENKNKLMFGGLREYLNEQYLAEHPIIQFMKNDSLSEFEVFSARMSDINDPAYHLDFNDPDSFAAFLERIGAPPDTEQIITLSTCVGADNDRRMIVQGALKRIVPVKTEHSENGWTIVKQPN